MKLKWKKDGHFADESSARYSTTLPNGDRVRIAKCSYLGEWKVVWWQVGEDNSYKEMSLGQEREQAFNSCYTSPTKKGVQKYIEEYCEYEFRQKFEYKIKSGERELLSVEVVFGSFEKPWPKDWKNSVWAQRAIQDAKQEIINEYFNIEIKY